MSQAKGVTMGIMEHIQQTVAYKNWSDIDEDEIGYWEHKGYVYKEDKTLPNGLKVVLWEKVEVSGTLYNEEPIENYRPKDKE